MHFLPVVNKARKPKFEVHLRIYDLNNIPLVSGVSQIKWYLPHSIHTDHRGRTAKCPISNHRVEYLYGKIIPARIHIGRNEILEECPIEFEVTQDFGATDEKVLLGKVRINLSEYVEESEAILRDSARGRPSTAGSYGFGAALTAEAEHLHTSYHKLGHARSRSSGSASRVSENAPTTAGASSPASQTSSNSGGLQEGGDEASSTGAPGAPEVKEGVIRRYLLQDSKINSTLRIGILMVQIDGDRNYSAPPLRTAPTFGGIAGLMVGEQPDKEDPLNGQTPYSAARARDASEMQDMYRIALTASWASPSNPGELSADACIEDIFSGGTGFTDVEDLDSSSAEGPGGSSDATKHRRQRSGRSAHFSHNPVSAASSLAPPTSLSRDDSGGSPSSADDNTHPTSGGSGGGTLRPRDVRSFFHRSSGGGGGSSGSEQQPPRAPTEGRFHHRRQRSGASDKSVRTLVMTSADGTTTAPSSGGGLRAFVDRSRARSPGPASSTSNNKRTSPADGGSAGSNNNNSAGSLGLPPAPHLPHSHSHQRAPSRGRSESFASLATTVGSDLDRGRDGFRRAREVDEFEVRDDLVAWRLPGKVT